jgi:ATP/maltotriose-dependent transcriptional regulator MalT
LLRGCLGDQQADRVGELHRRASLWYEQNGFVSQAIGHPLDAQDVERAAELVEQAAINVLMRSELSSLARG